MPGISQPAVHPSFGRPTRNYDGKKNRILTWIIIFIIAASLFICTVFEQSVRMKCGFSKPVYYNFQRKAPIYRPTRNEMRNNSELMKYEQEIYTKVPKKFEPDFKTPCWYNQDNQLMCLPYFYIAGFAKCGTTDLWDKIVKHPSIIPVCKEPHWWAWRHYGISKLPICQKQASKTDVVSRKSDSSIEWFLQFYRIQGVTDQIAKSNESTSTSFHPMVFGDASVSTSYSTDGSFFRKYQLPNEQFATTIPKLLYSVTPDVKILFILRDPVDRLYSAYWASGFGRRGSGSPKDFHIFATNAVTCFEMCLQTHSLYYCAHHIELCKVYTHSYIDKLPIGMYSVFIKDWLDAFPRNQLHFITLNEYKKYPTKTLSGIFRFMDLPPFEVTVEDTKRPKNSAKKYPDMLPKTRNLLQDFYRPFNDELVKLLDDARFSFSPK